VAIHAGARGVASRHLAALAPAAQVRGVSLPTLAAVMRPGLLVLATTAAATFAHPQGTAPLALRGATIHTGTGQTIRNGTIVVQDG
jgi:hypothetical protein